MTYLCKKIINQSWHQQQQRNKSLELKRSRRSNGTKKSKNPKKLVKKESKEANEKKSKKKRSKSGGSKDLSPFANTIVEQVKVFMKQQHQQQQRNKSSESKRSRLSSGTNVSKSNNLENNELEVVSMKMPREGGKLIHRKYVPSLSRLSPTGDIAKINNSVSREEKFSVKSCGSKKKKKSKKKKRGKTNRKSRKSAGSPQKSSSISGRAAARNKQSKKAVVVIVEKQDRKIMGKKSPTFGDDRTNLLMKQYGASGGGKKFKIQNSEMRRKKS